MTTDFNKNMSKVPGGFTPLSVDTPLDGRTRVETESDIMEIPKPYIGMIVYVKDTGKRFEITALKSKKIGLSVIEDAAVDQYKEFTVGVGSGSSGDGSNIDLSGYALKTELPTKTSQLVNDSSFATETYVTDRIAEASLGGGDIGSVNLSEYQKIVDNDLTTTSKRIPEAINEIKADVDTINPDGIVYFEKDAEAVDINIKANNIQITDSEGKLNSDNVEDALKEISDKIDTTAYALPRATSSTLGGIKVGSGLTISADGTLNSNSVNYTLPVASNSTLGGIKVGSGLSISNGTLNNAYTIPKATSSALGGIKIGNGLSIDSNGVVSVTNQGNGNYTLPAASATTLGGVKVGSGLKIDSNGVLSSTAGGNYTLPVASATTLGGVKIGSGLTINNGVLSATATGSGGTIQIDPDSYSGTDFQKLQSAITAACNLTLSDIKAQININRMYNITGAGTLKWSDDGYRTNRPIYMVGNGQGGIRKDDAGFMFDGNGIRANYNDHFINLYFVSKAGAGTKIFNGRIFIASVWANCSFRNVDTVAYSSTYFQSVRMYYCSINGGQGNCIDFKGLYDCTFDNLIIEHRSGTIFNQQEAPAAVHNYLYAARWRDCLIEGINGTCFMFNHITTAVMDGVYMEENTANVVFRPGCQIYAFEIANTSYYGTKSNALIQWNGTVRNAFSHNNYCCNQPLHDTSRLTSTSGLVSFQDYCDRPQIGTLRPKTINIS